MGNPPINQSFQKLNFLRRDFYIHKLRITEGQIMAIRKLIEDNL